MSEFVDPCAAGGVYADLPDGNHPCPTCGRQVTVWSGRWTDHSVCPATLVQIHEGHTVSEQEMAPGDLSGIRWRIWTALGSCMLAAARIDKATP